MTAKEPVSASLEDYLEAILQIVIRKQAARGKDIAAELGVSPSSVTGALHSLADRGLINYAPYDIVTLTPKGKKIAEKVLRRHLALRQFLVKVLGVGESEADEVACRMEHVVSRTIVDRLAACTEFVEGCLPEGADWLTEFRRFVDRSSAQSQAPPAKREV
jgi:DtxR family Mn-dependent transcriptional regulator